MSHTQTSSAAERAEAELAHTVETLRLRTTALHRISRTNDELRARLAGAERERDELRAKVEALADEIERGLWGQHWLDLNVNGAVRAVLDGGR